MAILRNLRFTHFWLAGGVALIGVVLFLTLAPFSGPDFGHSDKLGHLGAFAVLMIWFCGVLRLRHAPQIALGLLAFGILIEFLQSLTNHRTAEVADVAFDFLGVLFGWALAVAGVGRWATTIESWLPDSTS